jgi:hypothetical protein
MNHVQILHAHEVQFLHAFEVQILLFAPPECKKTTYARMQISLLSLNAKITVTPAGKFCKLAGVD